MARLDWELITPMDWELLAPLDWELLAPLDFELLVPLDWELLARRDWEILAMWLDWTGNCWPCGPTEGTAAPVARLRELLVLWLD